MHEVLAYAADEARTTGAGQCTVTVHRDGSISVTDNGRGTDTRRDSDGRVVRKPVMSSKDLRFFDHPSVETLPDGHPRRGMSVVAALSDWLVHTNRRLDGAWRQRYAHGVPVTDLDPVQPNGTTGTMVRFRPCGDVAALSAIAGLAVAGCASPGSGSPRPPVGAGRTSPADPGALATAGGVASCDVSCQGNGRQAG